MDTTAAKLDELADLRAAVDLTQAEYETRRAEILKAVQHELDALDAEYKPLLESAQSRALALETEIRESVLRLGGSVRGHKLYAMYSRGRVTWDTKGLDNYARTHPEVVGFRRQGEPSVSIRVVR